jgi:hypothetical protein
LFVFLRETCLGSNTAKETPLFLAIFRYVVLLLCHWLLSSNKDMAKNNRHRLNCHILTRLAVSLESLTHKSVSTKLRTQ